MNSIPDMNVLHFESQMSFEINPQKSIFLFSFLKLDAQNDWGSFSFKPIVKVNKEEIKCNFKADQENTVSQSNSTSEVGIVPSNMKACPFCTFHNPINAFTCEACLNEFKDNNSRAVKYSSNVDQGSNSQSSATHPLISN